MAGIGGSYLGAKAVIEALSNSFTWLLNDKNNPTILFAGNNIGEDYLAELTAYLADKKFGVINISKSGTTTETALTFSQGFLKLLFYVFRNDYSLVHNSD